MNAKSNVMILLLLILSMNVTFFSVNAVDSKLKIMSVVFNSEQPARGNVNIMVTIAHNASIIPNVLVYYTYFLNGSILVGDWRVSSGKAVSVVEPGLTVFNASIPNPVYNEVFPYNSKVVFYIEARDALGGYALSCDESKRWSPYDVEGKFVFYTVDVTPPSVKAINVMPSEPIVNESVKLSITLSDVDSGISGVDVRYYYNGREMSALVDYMGSVKSEYYYIVEFGVFQKPSHVEYVMEAVDRSGNKLRRTGGFDVASIPEKTPERPWLRWFKLGTLIMAMLALLTLAFYAIRRKVKKGEVLARPKHPKAMTFMFLIILGFAIALYIQLARMYKAPLLGLIFVFFMIVGWGVMDPRIEIGLPIKVWVDENPPSTLIFEGFLVGILSIIVFLVYVFLGFLPLQEGFKLATLLAKYVIALLVLGFLLQFSWSYLKETNISIEVERI